jgi:hypothetical protein
LTNLQSFLSLENIESLSESSSIAIPDNFDVVDYKACVDSYFSGFRETLYSRKNFLKSVYDSDVKEFSESIFDKETENLLPTKVVQLFRVTYPLEQTKSELKKLIGCCNDEIKAAAIRGAPITPSSVTSSQVAPSASSSGKTPATNSSKPTNGIIRNPSSAIASATLTIYPYEQPVAITPPKVSNCLSFLLFVNLFT